jgi:hypothetical protein
MGQGYQLPDRPHRRGKESLRPDFSRVCSYFYSPGITTGYRVTEKGDWVKKADGTEYQKAVARELRSELQALDTAGREIVILFDFREGDYSESPEFKAATTTAKLFKSAIAKIAQLPGPDKGADDFA